jgi:hypothetical protein
VFSKHPESGADATEENAFDGVELASRLRFCPFELFFGEVGDFWDIFVIINF